MATQQEWLVQSNRVHDACVKCGLPAVDAHLTRCPKCGLPRVRETKLLSTPLRGQPWASVEGAPAGRTSDGDAWDSSDVRVRITATTGNQAGRSVTYSGHQVVLAGRCPKNDFAFDDDYASWHHLLLEVNPPWVHLRDLDSLNGVYVNRVRVGMAHAGHGPTSVMLRHGDTVVFGMSAITLEIGAASPPPRPARPEEAPSIPGFEVQRELSGVGPGRTFRAVRSQDHAPFTLTVLNPNQPIAPASEDYVMHRLHALHTLRFPHLARVEDAGIHEGWCWIATKYKPGDCERLARRRGGQLPCEVVVPIMLQSLKGLAYAHTMGFVHHDIRPSSILIRKEKNAQFVQIRDVGVISLITQLGLNPTLLEDTDAFDYMPRERVTGFRKVLPASDVWSIAACFYYLLTGVPPRDNESQRMPICTVLESDPLPIRERQPNIPEPIAEVLDTALAPEPSRRFADAEAFRDAVKAAARVSGLGSNPSDSA